MHSPKFETGSREHLKLHRAQDEGLEICGRSREEREPHYWSMRTYCSPCRRFCKSAQCLVLELVLWAQERSCRYPHEHSLGAVRGKGTM